MAITPRTIISSPASATVATVALLAFSAVGTLAYQVANRSTQPTPTTFSSNTTSCDSVRKVIGPNMAKWSENAWIVLASCYENRNDSMSAARVASHGTHFYPRSETLYNIAGYNEIARGEYARAMITLNTGLRSVENPSNGVMANNLAWASLWVPNASRTTNARGLYQSALRYDQNSCETLHTGLWVEYSIASKSRSGVRQAQALRNFQNLRARYNSCENRVNDGRWKSMVEVVGAAVLFDNVDRSLRTRPAYGSQTEGRQSLMRVTKKLRENYKGRSISKLCDQAMPLASTRRGCVRSVSHAIHSLRAEESGATHRLNSLNRSEKRGCGSDKYRHRR